MFSADISKSEEISRWRPINKTLHYDFSATEMLFKNCHNCLSEGLTFFLLLGSSRSETKYSPRLQANRQTHTQTDRQTYTQTDCYNPPPTRHGAKYFGICAKIHLSTLLEVLILVLKYNQPCHVVLVFIT